MRSYEFLCNRSAFILALVSLATASHTVAGDQDQRLRESIERSLTHLQVEGETWIKERQCVSCHRIGIMTWSLREAADRGFKVDHDQLEEWIDWSWNDVTSEDRVTGETVAIRNLEGVAQLIIGLQGDGGLTNRIKEHAAVTEIMLTKQEADGCWKPGGQLPQQKRPINETRQVSAIWNAIALHRLQPNVDKAAECIQQVRDSFERPIRPVSTEWHAAHVLFAQEFTNHTRCQQHREVLVAHQRPDGGWGWLVEEQSDALATGIAMYALLKTGFPEDDPVVRKATSFLLETQLEDGSWDVHGTKDVARDSIEETACYWGTAWATLSLLQLLPTISR